MSHAELKTFVQLASYMNQGRLLDQLDAAVRKAVEEVQHVCMEAGGVHKAKLTLDLTFKMDQKDGIMEVTPDLKEKYPKVGLGRGASLWPTENNTLSRENPKQRSMFDDNDIERQRRQNAGESVGAHSA